MTKYGYDVMGNMTSYVDAWGKVTKYTYDLEGNLTSREDPAGRKEQYGYDEMGRLTSWTMPSGKKVKYDYDKLNNLLEKSYEDIKESEGSGSSSGKDEASGSGDGTGNASGSSNAGDDVKDGLRVTYAYNGAGERVAMQDVTGESTYEYDALGRLSKVTNGSGKEVSYIYDEADNLAAVVYPVEYEYTAENRLAVVSQGGTVLMAAMYDGDNNRVFQIDNTYKWEDCYGDDVLIPKSERTENGDSPQEELASLVKGGVNAKGYTLTEYVNDVNRENTEVLAEYKADNTVRQAYTYGESGNGERIGVDKVDKSTETSYYVYDGRGSVTGLVTNDGKLMNSYTYDPYGTLTSGTADAVNYYGYNAESTNTKTGLQYLRARYYDPENGNFTSEDTEDGELPFPLMRNRYVYALNNPLNYKDPTGHKSKAVGKGAGAVSGAVGGVMDAIGTRTGTKQNVNRPVKNIASSPKRATQRETGNASGAASGHSKGGSVQASGSTGNKAGNMASRDTGKLAGKSGVTRNQRPGYKEQMARVQVEQSKKVTCAAGQMNASAMANAGVWSPDMTQELWQLFPLLTPEMLALLAALAP